MLRLHPQLPEQGYCQLPRAAAGQGPQRGLHLLPILRLRILVGRIKQSNLTSSILISKYYRRYVNEHKSRGLPSSLLAGTMALVTSCNSALAITAGQLSC